VKAFIPCEHYKWFPVLELKSLLGFEEQWTCTRPTQKKKQKGKPAHKGFTQNMLLQNFYLSNP